MSARDNYLRLKWGSIKAFDFKDQGCLDLAWAWQDLGVCVSAALQRNSEEQKELTLKLIDKVEEVKGTIFLDWDGEYVNAEKAKKYILEYND